MHVPPPPPPPSAPLAPAPAPPSITVGALVDRTFWVWKQNLARFAAVTLVLQAPSLVLAWAVASPLGAALGPFRPPPPGSPGFAFANPGYWALAAVGVVLTLVHVGALTTGTIQHLAGRRASVGEMLGSGLRRIGPILVAGLLAVLAMYVGLLFLVVPGVVLALMFSLVVPVVMAESLGPVASLGRSRALTRGHRWVLLGAFLVFYLVVAGLGLAVLGITYVAPTFGRALNVAVNAIFGSLLYVVPAVAYHDLRVAKEGVDTALLARVFE